MSKMTENDLIDFLNTDSGKQSGDQARALRKAFIHARLVIVTPEIRQHVLLAQQLYDQRHKVIEPIVKHAPRVPRDVVDAALTYDRGMEEAMQRLEKTTLTALTFGTGSDAAAA